MADFTIIGHDTLHTIIPCQYDGDQTLADGTTVSDGDPFRLDGFDPDGFYGVAAPPQGHTHEGQFAVALDVSLFGSPIAGELRVLARDSECAKPQEAGFKDEDIMEYDLWGIELVTGRRQRIRHGECDFSWSAGQVSS